MHGVISVKKLPLQQPKTRKQRRKAARQKIYDRRAALPESPNFRTVVVDDPYELGGKITVIASLRDDPLARLHKRQQIDEAQYQACRAYQRLHERAELIPVKAMDPTKEPVDGGGSVPDPFTDGKRKAIKELIRIHDVLGDEGAALVRGVLMLRLFFGQIAQTRNKDPRYIGMRFCECAETLAIELGYAPKKRSAVKPYEKVC